MVDDDAEDPPVRVRRPPPRDLDVSNELLRDIDTAPGVIRTVHLPQEALDRAYAAIAKRTKARDDQAAEDSGSAAAPRTPARSGESAAR